MSGRPVLILPDNSGKPMPITILANTGFVEDTAVSVSVHGDHKSHVPSCMNCKNRYTVILAKITQRILKEALKDAPQDPNTCVDSNRHFCDNTRLP